MRSWKGKVMLFLMFCALTVGATGLFYWTMENPALSGWTRSLLGSIPVFGGATGRTEEQQALAPVESEKEPLWIVSSSSPESSQDNRKEDAYPWNLFLIGPGNPLPEEWEQVLLSFQGIEVDSRILQPLKNLMYAAQKDGVYLSLYNGYTEPEKVTQSSGNSPSSFESGENSSAVSSSQVEDSRIQTSFPISEKNLPSEQSEHATGLSVDFSGSPGEFFQSEEYIWLTENAPKYGFVLRYPWGKEEITGVSFAPQHFRYVGKEVALEMEEKGICLEEYRENYREAVESGG